MICFCSFGCLWSSCCAPWHDFGRPFGTLWGAFGSQGALLGLTLASLWVPWDAGWPAWATLGAQVELGMTLVKMDVRFRYYLSVCDACTQKVTLRNSRAAAPAAPAANDPCKVAPELSSQPHFTRAGGQDDVSLEQIPKHDASLERCDETT